jgi:His-Xaa-Ser system protein HxsD
MLEPHTTSGFLCEADGLGLFARVSVDPCIYSETAILKTAYWFTDYYYLFLMKNHGTGLIDLEIRLKTGEDIDALKSACGQFWNRLLDQEVRQRVIEETSCVRDTLIKKAFFEAHAVLPDRCISDESQVPKPGQSNLEGPGTSC